jgi:AraC-like DNA-binding protein
VKWIRFLLLGLMITVSLDIVITIYELLDGTYFAEAEHVITLFMVSMILYLGYYGYLQSTILLPQYLFETTPTNNNTTVHTIEKHTTTEVIHHLSNASEDEIEALKQKLLDLLEKEKIHLDEDLTLGSLAKALSTTEKKLSALLNHYLNISFYDFINGYRVNAAIEKLTHQDYGHFTILAIAYDSGFKSKSSFNRIFKKTTGLSPSAYKKQHQ